MNLEKTSKYSDWESKVIEKYSSDRPDCSLLFKNGEWKIIFKDNLSGKEFNVNILNSENIEIPNSSNFTTSYAQEKEEIKKEETGKEKIKKEEIKKEEKEIPQPVALNDTITEHVDGDKLTKLKEELLDEQ